MTQKTVLFRNGVIYFVINPLKNINIDTIIPANVYIQVSTNCVYSHNNFEMFVLKWKSLLVKVTVFMFISMMIKVDEGRPPATSQS